MSGIVPLGGAAASQGRIEWIDAARGICILLVVLGHCFMELDDPVNRFILSFHMPAFFFLSGLCSKEPRVSFVKFLKKKARAILIPQLTLAALVLAYSVLSTGFTWQTLLSSLLVWFLPVLFICSLFFYVVSRLFGSKPVVWLTTVVLSLLLAAAIDPFGLAVGPIHLETVFAAFSFYSLGYLARVKNVGIIDFSTKFRGGWILLPVIMVIVSQVNAPIAMYEGSYGNWAAFFFGAVVGIVFICCLGNALSDNVLFKWLGVNSIVMFVVHFRLIPLLRAICVRILPVAFLTSYQAIWPWILFASTLVVLIPLMIICEKRLMFLFGKSR